MSRSARNAVIADWSESVVLSSGTLKCAMIHLLVLAAERCRTANRLEEKLENLHVALGVTERFSPRVQPVPAKEERVRQGIALQRLADHTGQPCHVLIVVDDW